MAEHVEVVIKIPKYYLTHPQDYTCLAECVRRGVLLPKGHGRLISEEDMLSVIMFSKLFDDAKVREVKEALLKIPTIIEADGGG